MEMYENTMWEKTRNVNLLFILKLRRYTVMREKFI